ncbi:protein kinase family protein [Pseudomonas cichorii]|uniref:protein kinase family protein n=1 Tax=Pseudomonas cichorii TaxID=36746 RepID=UPI001C888650|nr:protein kinase family protein [Pseudomonas cichorii]MBX8484959.1 protein kinase family protein [Pseudomonas cichorii]MBX8560832.1 protein kinase family protein [Pseudomonas cichorii]
MGYPSLEQYQEALQHPRVALLDGDLKSGSIAISGLGLPKVMCGGFALTYTISVGSGKYAVRCFHKQSPDLEMRYKAVSSKLKALSSNYFLPFEFQPQGVQVQGAKFPIVKMAWAAGDTLGEFVSDNFRNGSVLATLRESIVKLASYLEAQLIAHGDLQPGNLMVSQGGRLIQLIDYDGMFVPEIKQLGAAEIGHRNFQHPSRTGKNFNASLDRFSFISLVVALKALERNPALWDESQSDWDSFVFRASDFSDPASSKIFKKLISDPLNSNDAKSFASICLSSFDQVPSLADFLAGKGIPHRQFEVKSRPAEPVSYSSQYPVLSAADYNIFVKNIGNMVELVGQVVEVKHGKTKKGGRSYIFVNFGPWQGSIVKLSIWPAALAKMKSAPSSSLVGSWISVVGLVEPVYSNKKYRYNHIAIDISSQNQIKHISSEEAKFRLAAKSLNVAGLGKNQEIIERLRVQNPGTSSVIPPTTSALRSQPSHSANAAILQKIQNSQARQQSPQRVLPRTVVNSPTMTQRQSVPQVSSSSKKAKTKSGGIPGWVWIVGLLILIAIVRQ